MKKLLPNIKERATQLEKITTQEGAALSDEEISAKKGAVISDEYSIMNT